MSLDALAVVRLLTDRCRDEGVSAGAFVVVLDAYADAHEVEFLRADGSTIAWFAVGQNEVEPYVGIDAPSGTQ